MGRKKGYARQALITAARDVFHRRGFKGASTDILVRELAVNRNSVYSEFGSKENLFSAALADYNQQVVSHFFGPLEAPDASLNEVEELFHAFAGVASDAKGIGCLMCNAAAELGGTEPNLQPQIDSHFSRLYDCFRNALEGATRRGQIPRGIDINGEAWFLTSVCTGISLLIRSDISSAAALGAVEGTLQHLQRMRQTESA